MFRPKKAIPKLVIGMLALTGCPGTDDGMLGGSGGDGGMGGTGGSAGSGGSAGTGGAAGSGGSAGTAGSGGSAGTAGSGGSAGTGGTAGSGGIGGVGGTAGNDLANAVGAWCMKFVDECHFIGGTSVEECTEYYVDYWGGWSAECQAAISSYFECVGEQEGCDDFTACHDDLDAFYDACL